MRFALVGDHPDGREMARALAASGRHEFRAYCGPAAGRDFLQENGLTFATVPDFAELLADPEIELLLVASPLGVRATHLRRALQAERAVLCVYPPDRTPDIAYEAALIQGDTRQVLMPLIPEVLHPGIRKLAELLRMQQKADSLQLLHLECWTPADHTSVDDVAAHPDSLPIWPLLRSVGGEIAEVSTFAQREELNLDQPLLISGRFEAGGLFHADLLPSQAHARQRLTLRGLRGSWRLDFPDGWRGRARLIGLGEASAVVDEGWDDWSPWPALVDIFEQVLRQANAGVKPAARSAGFTWQDAIRGLELDDAARRSVERRRVSALEYPEASEAVGIKGTMTLVGCGLLLVLPLLVLVLALLFPSRSWWIVLPGMALFLVLQLLIWLLPRSEAKNPPSA